jgi:hypothetical protein
VAPEVQARWIEDAFRLAAARSDYIGLALVYLLQDYGDSFGGRTGLIDRAGQAKPAFAQVAGQWQDLRAHRYAAAELRWHGRPLALLEIRRRGELIRAHATRLPGLGTLPALLCLTAGRATRCGATGATLDGVPARLAARATLKTAGAGVAAWLPGGR